ncbi:aconitate hydratase AcnA [Pararhodobacter oceanensis]|uniref:aconitate hydratase AcnA n=1 Tax=Pararhodobacter oceanensis TaxID=2172121 RepID=UPI003A916DC2
MKDKPLLQFIIPEQGEHWCVDLPALLAGRRAPLPASLKIVLENIIRQAHVAGSMSGTAAEAVEALSDWTADSNEVIAPLRVSRVMLPDSSGLPVLMDLAAARDVVVRAGGDPTTVEPAIPVALVIDHSLIVDFAGHPNARHRNVAEEYRRNRERYEFFKWAQGAFQRLEVVPPGAGIIHQVHLEKIARVVEQVALPDGRRITGPEFVLGCDSHTAMVNGLGLLAWGVGGIDGEAAALGRPYSVRIPRVVGVRLSGELPAGTTTTDLVLTVTETLRRTDVVGAFVEFFGAGVDSLSVPERATLANMAPEYGATVGFFAIDQQVVNYLSESGRDPAHVQLVEYYAKAAGLFVDHNAPGPEAEYSQIVEIDLASIVPSVSGPKRPQDRVALSEIKPAFRATLTQPVAQGGFGLSSAELEKNLSVGGFAQPIEHGIIPIAAITSCTNTSNPSVMIGAGLLARNAVARGLSVPDWVKTSMAPGSRLVEDYLNDAGLMDPLEQLGFHIVGFGCTTCSGKSGPIDTGLASAIEANDVVAAAVLSGNRNFEGRIHKSCRAAYLMSPPLVVAFALAGRVDIDFESDPIGADGDGRNVYLRDLWPDPAELALLVAQSQSPERFRASYANLFDAPELWQSLDAPKGPVFKWDGGSTYICRPPFFDLKPYPVEDCIEGARVLVKAGDSLTTDFITPSGEILEGSQAGQYLMAAGVAPVDFNAVTQRRGNHEFMARSTFANQRMKNRLVDGIEGGFTRQSRDGSPLTIYDAAESYRQNDVPVIVLAGRDYGMGSSRDWAAKGPRLLNVRLILAESFERIHRGNLIGMGIMPLVFCEGQSCGSLGLTGFEAFRFEGLLDAVRLGAPVSVSAMCDDGKTIRFTAHVDIASDHERQLLQEGGIFASMLQNLQEDKQ